MIFAGERCLKLHRIMFVAMGLWPYQKQVIWRIQTICFFGLYFGGLASQSAIFLTTVDCKMDCLLKRFSYISMTLACILYYYSFYFNSEIIKQIIEHMQLDWKMFENTYAMKIFEEYLVEAYAFGIFSYTSILVGGCVFAIIESRFTVLDIIMPMNVSRPRKIEIEFECFIDKKQYFVLYLVEELMGLFIILCSLITTGTFMVTLGKHLCASYKIASYLIENAVTICTLQLPVSQGMIFMHRRICLSVYIHGRTMEIYKSAIEAFDLWFFPLLLIGVLALSCIFFRVYIDIIEYTDLYDIIISSMVLCLCVAYMFVANFLIHVLCEHNMELLDSLYKTLWYLAPLSIQKLFLVMQKSMKGYKLVLGGLFVPSVEGFSTLITSAISYFTMMYAMR